MFKPLLTKQERQDLKGPANKVARQSLREERKWERWPETGHPPWLDEVGPVVLMALEKLARAAVQLIANDLLSDGDTKHGKAVALVLDLAGENKKTAVTIADNLVRRAFDEVRDAGEL